MDGGDGERQEVVLVTRAVPAQPPGPLDALLGVVAGSVGMVTASASAVASMIEHTVGQAVESSVNSALDRLVPAIADAIVERLDLTCLVIEQVDLNRVVNSALDSLDLTQLVVDRVDVAAIVEQADIERIIDRLPVIPLANYVIEEIDLPQIIRESTGGVATDAVNAVRVQGVGADQLVSRLADRVLLRRRQRKTEAPGEPESLMGRLRDDFASDAREETVGTAGPGATQPTP